MLSIHLEHVTLSSAALFNIYLERTHAMLSFHLDTIIYIKDREQNAALFSTPLFKQRELNDTSTA